MGRGRSGKKKIASGFKKFTDTHDGSGFSFRGDGKETIKFFDENSNYNELIMSMNRDDHDAFEEWMSGLFMNGQQYRGFDNMNEWEQQYTRSFDKILDKATLKQGIEVRRLASAELLLGKGNRTGNQKDLDAMKGRIVTSTGNMSTAAAATGLSIGDRSKNVEYVYKIPGGTKGAGMWIGDNRIGGWGAKQREFMMNRDTAWSVGKTTFNKSRGVYEVEMNWVGLMEHDYGKKGRKRR